MAMQSGFIKRIRDIMRMDAGINGDAQRIEQMVWMLFLKVYDAKEEDPDKVTITRNDAGDFIVSSKSLNKLVAMTNFGNDEAIRRFQYIWRIKGIDKKLIERGIKEGNTVRIGEMEFEYRD